MATIGSFTPYGMRTADLRPRYGSHGAISSSLLRISTVGNNFHGIRMSDVDYRVRCTTETNIEKGIATDVQSPEPVAPEKSSTWGLFESIINLALPFFKKPLSKLENDVEMAIDVVDNVAEAVEKVANAVEDFASDMADNLQEGKLQDAAEMVENISKKLAEQADKTSDLADKVSNI
eukprot:TRINITY_DN2922_c0_g1_i1.p1 TRINITY_DN2922_c0_g1~~TRINITY_DN2922_c0_g1_i1.p1  ORF type:complete len:177 (+),score=29.72 TRINITY_DN2922_c0_g1_i1:171-701(+)